MKTSLRISLILNMALLGALLFLLSAGQKHATTASPAPAERQPPSQSMPAPAAASQSWSAAPARLFRWSDLQSSNGYAVFVANLRAAGCPEPTISDIVRGDFDRAFFWERQQLNVDGSGSGPWSQAREGQLIASLLGGPAVQNGSGAQGRENAGGVNGLGNEPAEVSTPNTQSASSTPLFMQNVNWNAMGFTPAQQDAIAQVRQQFQNQTANLNQSSTGAANQNPTSSNPSDVSSSPNTTASNPDSGDSATPTKWQNAVEEANNELSGLLGAQAYEAYEQEQYLEWYTPQVKAAAASGTDLIIIPDDFHPIQ